MKVDQQGSEITIRELQENIDQWIRTVGVRYFSELTNLGILMEEVGELSRIMVRKYGEQSFKSKESETGLEDEIADVLWVLTAIANQTGINLTKAIRNNMEKKNKRDHKRHQENPKLKKD